MKKALDDKQKYLFESRNEVEDEVPKSFSDVEKSIGIFKKVTMKTI